MIFIQIPAEGHQDPMSRLNDVCPQWFDGQHKVFLLYIEEHEMYVARDTPFTKEEYLQWHDQA